VWSMKNLVISHGGNHCVSEVSPLEACQLALANLF
jgi:hypothetical protein